MNKTVFFFITLIVMAFCSNSKAASFSGILDKLVQLNQAAGKDANEISLLVSQVSSSTQESNNNFDTFITGLVSRCSQGSQVQSDFMAKLDADRLSVLTKSNDATAAITSIGGQKDGLLDQVSSTKADLEKLKADIKTAYEEYKTYGVEAEQKLVVIKTLRDIISDELLAASGDTPSANASSFVQLKTFNDKLGQLKTLLEKSQDNSYAPLVSTLLSLAEKKGFADSSILNQILTVLNTLESSLKEFRDKQDTNGKANIKTLKDQAEEKVTQVKLLSTMVAGYTSDIEDNNNIVKAGVLDMGVIDAEKLRKIDEAAYWTKICDYQLLVKGKEDTFRAAFVAKVKDVTKKLVDLN